MTIVIIQTFLLVAGLAAESFPAVDEILERAIETAARSEALKPESRYTFRVTTRAVQLRGDGHARSTERQVHENRLVDGVPFLRLVEKDGRELTAYEKRREDDRERKAHAKKEKEPGLRFDEDLVDRFRVEVVGVEMRRGRAAYVLSFEPLSRQLSEHERLDRIVNRARGRIWLDVATYEISRVSFELSEDVLFGAALLGKLTELQGEFTRAPASDDIWMPRQLELRMKGRALLKGFHRVEEVDWHDFEEAQP